MNSLLGLALTGWALVTVLGAEPLAVHQDLSEIQTTSTRANSQAEPPKRLAVIVPAHAGDLSRAIKSLEHWPKLCSSVTLEHADLVLYYAEGPDESTANAIPTLQETGGRCFANTRVIYAKLNEEDDVYPKGPSVQFYKMFLDEDVSSQLSDYDALAIIEWDVLVASDHSFEQLYHSAFDGTEHFWVKGSTLEGSNFHQVAMATSMWHVLGHINGNAIYNNNDPAFVEYVDYTLARWQYTYPYDVALWATIADFPYSWPLWQRYSSKFVATNLISNVGIAKVSRDAVTNAVAGDTLFIHGSSVSGGSIDARREASDHVTEQHEPKLMCESACGTETLGLPEGMSTVCDATCSVEEARFDGFLCGAGNTRKYGAMCRMCYVDHDSAIQADRQLRVSSDRQEDSGAKHFIMCDTLKPPEAPDCSEECTTRKDTVCDDSCGTGRHGDYNCNWRGRGKKCRYCFNDIADALLADEVAKRHGGRVIMCDTHEPPVMTDIMAETINEETSPALSRRRLQQQSKTENRSTHRDLADGDDTEGRKTRKLQKWRETERWKRLEKWKGGPGVEPKWRTIEKWRNNRCLDGCKRTSFDGTKGRVCDSSCKTGEPWGMNGCNAKQGEFGRYCRVCYNDEDLARSRTSDESPVIMCATLAPPDYESVARKLSAEDNTEGTSTRKLQKWRETERWKRLEKWKGGPGVEPKWRTIEKWRNNRCLDGCKRTSFDGTKGRVCDSSCKTGEPWGMNGCNAKQGEFGRYCRVCYNDEDLARSRTSDESPVIMCSTLAPPDYESVARKLSAEDNTEGTSTRKLQKWRETERWKRLEKWKGGPGVEPKWRTIEKWRNNRCLDGCERTSFDGTKGRVCDSSCKTGEPWGMNGCNAKQGEFGRYCRVCYNNEDLARSRTSDESPVIMCATLAPPDYESVARKLSAEDNTEGTSTRKLQKWRETERWKRLEKWKGGPGVEPKWRTIEKWRNNRCLDGCKRTSFDGTKGRVCDSSCKTGEPWGMNGCNAKQGEFGRYCRVCYNNEDLARSRTSDESPVIMCSTLAPPDYESVARKLSAEDNTEGTSTRKLQKWRETERWKRLEKWKGGPGVEPKWRTIEKWRNNRCLDGCERTSFDGTKGRVCDSSCKTGEPWGMNGCNAKQGEFGRYCRVCYNDEDLARSRTSDESPVIMCATLAPPDYESVARKLSAEDNTEGTSTRKLQKWRETERWKRLEKWKGGPGVEPKWRTIEKWRNNRCLDGCERTSFDGTKGRVCDSSCKTGEPWGMNGCNAKQGEFGRYCRVCYNDEDLARSRTSDESPVIMCATLAPPDYESVARKLSAEDNTEGTSTRKLQKWRETERWKRLEKWKGGPGVEPKWKTIEKWRNNRCLDGCERTSFDGTKGRVCDSSCKTGEPWGMNGCNAKQGEFGRYCRVCYNNEDLARSRTSDESPVIMCATLAPPDYESVARKLSAEDNTEGTSTRKLQKWRETERWKRLEKWKGGPGVEPKWRTIEKWRNNRCLDGCKRTSFDGTKGRVCDSSCKTGEPWGMNGCNAKQGEFGRYCRVCYNDEDLARSRTSDESPVIMCATLAPPDYESVARKLSAEDNTEGTSTRKLQKWRETERWKRLEKWKGGPGVEPKWRTIEKWRNNRCLDGCERTSFDGTKGRVCDSSCKTGEPWGMNGCNAKQGEFGRYCRVCYNDEDLARSRTSDESPVIMCATLAPPDYESVARKLSAEDNTEGTSTRKLQKWRETERWKRLEKWKGGPGVEPKWRTIEKWRNNRCLDGCERTSFDGTKGRVCDSSCKTGEPWGMNGCNAKQGEFGRYCRVCYNNEDLARSRTSDESPVIMCATLAPPDYETVRRSRRLKSASHVGRSTVSDTVRPKLHSEEYDVAAAFADASEIPYTADLVRGNICAFITGDAEAMEANVVSVQSVIQFLPGMRVAVATDARSLRDYEMALGSYPGVSVSSASSLRSASLFADVYCGTGTKLVYYMVPGSVLSRAFTPKDTHSPRGDLLVSYVDARSSMRDKEMAQETMGILGFDPPSFVHGTDLMLPISANVDLRQLLVSEHGLGSIRDEDEAALTAISQYDRVYVPQVLAALAFSRNTPGIWFVNPQIWVTEHLFKEASIWDIPLVKPRFSCAVDPARLGSHVDVAGALVRSLEIFSNGGTCEDGLIHV